MKHIYTDVRSGNEGETDPLWFAAQTTATLVCFDNA